VGIEVTSCEMGGCGVAGAAGVCASADEAARIRRTGTVRRVRMIYLWNAA
jgi:hypothetical protein